MYKMDAHLQKNNFQICKMSKSSSPKKGLESMKLARELDDPYLNKIRLRGERFSQILLWIWLSLWFIGLLVVGILWLTGTVTFD
jgi:hypothetical protein